MAEGGGIWRARRVEAVRGGLLKRLAGGDGVASPLTARQGEDCGGYQEAGQNREGSPAAMADAASYPDETVVFVMGLSPPTAMADDGWIAADRAAARQER